jgi:hypothetical protein
MENQTEPFANEKEINNNEAQSKSKSKSKKGWIIGIISCCAFFFLLGLIGAALTIAILIKKTQEHKAKLEADIPNVVQDSLNGTNTAMQENQKYVRLLKDIFYQAKVESQNYYETCYLIDEDQNLFEPRTYKSQESINSYIINFEKCIQELQSAQKNYNNQILTVKDKIHQVTFLTEDQKKAVLKGYEETVKEDKNWKQLEKRTQALISYYQDILKLYKFMAKVYEFYEIKPDPYGEELIYFERDEDIITYDKIIDEITLSEEEFIKADEEYMNYYNQKLDKYNLDQESIQ